MSKKLNIPRKEQTPTVLTHEGGVARKISAELALRRSVMANLLFEREFYEDGVEIAARVADLVPKVDPDVVATLAVQARTKGNLRHIPLLLIRELARIGKLKAETLTAVINRADEITDFASLYASTGDGSREEEALFPNQVKRGLAQAFLKFDEYQFGKYNRKGASWTFLDVMRLVHPKAESNEAEGTDAEQAELLRKLREGRLAVPDTWEVRLSKGDDKKEAFESLIREEKLPAMATLRNLRKMEEVGVDRSLIVAYLDRINTSKILPFRFISAARAVPSFEEALERIMLTNLLEAPKLKGHTVLVVDVSWSMEDTISKKSEITRMDAACGLAILAREVCEDTDILTFSNDVKVIPARRGFALRDAIVNSQEHAGTNLPKVMHFLDAAMAKGQIRADRLIVFTDEQTRGRVPNPARNLKAYLVNVASAKNGVGYYNWIHIDGFSGAVIDYIHEYEKILPEIEKVKKELPPV